MSKNEGIEKYLRSRGQPSHYLLSLTTLLGRGIGRRDLNPHPLLIHTIPLSLVNKKNKRLRLKSTQQNATKCDRLRLYDGSVSIVHPYPVGDNS